MRQTIRFEDSVTAWEFAVFMGTQNGIKIINYGVDTNVQAKYYIEFTEVVREG